MYSSRPQDAACCAMLYQREFLSVFPATPESHDRLIALMQETLLPAYQRLGARLVGAFIAHNENWGQVVHLFEHDDLAAFDAFRRRTRGDAAYGVAQETLTALAPEQRSELLEPLDCVAVTALHAAIEAAREKPVGAYTFAELELAPGKAQAFERVLGAAKDRFPIVAAWRPVAGNPRMVFDLWKGALAQNGYQPATAQAMAFFGPLRELAPRERVVHLYPLPYSPLR
jgi:hypothetical protein